MIAPLVVALLAQEAASPPVVVTVAPTKVVLGARGVGQALVVATIRKGFRIQANPASQPFLVPARLEMSGAAHVQAGPPEYPPGKPHRLRGTTEDLSVYEDRVAIRLPLSAPPSRATTAPGDVVLEGRLRYQACNAEVCLRPTSVPVRVEVSLGSPSPGAGP